MRKRWRKPRPLEETLQSLPSRLDWLPRSMQVHVCRVYAMWEEWRINTPPATVVPYMCVAGMGLVFVA